MTEADVIAALRARMDAPGVLMAPNVTVLGGHESDLIVITKSRLIHEIEVKLTIADLRADTSPKSGSPKWLRACALEHAAETSRTLAGWRPTAAGLERIEHGHDLDDQARMRLACWPVAPITPHRFSFAVPKPLAEQALGEIPAWAGLFTLRVSPTGRYHYPVVQARAAARLHARADDVDDVERALLRSTYHRFWRERAQRLVAARGGALR